jgi:hypothetical protein
MSVQIAGNQIKNNAVDSSKIADNAIGADAIDLTATYTYSGALRAPTPTNAADVAIKSYVDGLVGSGVFWKEPCTAATTANITISNPGTDTFDGKALTSGDRLLVKDQSTGSENGIYQFNGSGSALTRTSDADTAAELEGAAVFVSEGNTSADQAFVQTADNITLGSTALTWVRFSGLGTVTAGDGLAKAGDTLSVNVDDSSIEISGDALRLKANGVTNAMLAGSIDAAKLAGSIGDNLLSTIATANKVSGSAVQLNAGGAVTNASGLKVNVDDSAIEISSNALTVKANGVTNAMLAGSIADSKLSTIATANKVSGSAVQLNGAGGLEDSSGLQISSGGVTNAMLAGSIADSKLSTIATANKVSGSAVQLASNGGLQDATGLKLNVDNSSIELSSGNLAIKGLGVSTAAIANQAVTQGKLANGSCGTDQIINLNVTTAKIADSAVSAAKVSFAPSVDKFTGNNSATTFDMSATVPAGFEAVLAFRNGIALDQVASSPSGVDQFILNRTAGAGSVSQLQFGTAPSSTDSIVVYFIA